MIKAAIIAVIWFGCGIAGSGFSNAHFRAEYPSLYRDGALAKREGRGLMGMSCLFGPISLVATYLWTGFGSDGWTLSTEPTPYPQVKP